MKAVLENVRSLHHDAKVVHLLIVIARAIAELVKLGQGPAHLLFHRRRDSQRKLHSAAFSAQVESRADDAGYPGGDRRGGYGSRERLQAIPRCLNSASTR